METDLKGVVERVRQYPTESPARKDFDHLLKLVRRMAEQIIVDNTLIFETHDGERKVYECQSCLEFGFTGNDVPHKPDCLFLLAQQALKEITEDWK